MRISSIRDAFKLSCALAAAVAVAGCSSTNRVGHVHTHSATSGIPIIDPRVPTVQPGTAVPGAPSPSASTLRIGDYVTVVFSDNSRDPIAPLKLQIGEDRSLTLSFNVRVQAVGKTPRARSRKSAANTYQGFTAS